ncbi:MAG: hypothetical protein H0W71_06070 [Sphingomonas sp.]|nr:hypothetical protein [Sphingomonas sp.]
MIPMKHSSIFKSRWMALIWAAGIIWFALDIAAPSATAGEPTDVTGAPVTSDDAAKIADIINGI